MFTSLLTYLFPPSEKELLVHRTHTLPLKLKTLTLEHMQVTTLSTYTDTTVRALIHRMKYQRDAEAYAILATALHDTLLSELGETVAMTALPYIVPIPSSKQRMEERGYDHLAELLHADTPQAHDIHPLICTNLLQKTHHTPPQTTLSTKERRQALKGSFSICTELPQRPIILIDDVVTTGATLHEAAKTLRKANFCDVSAIVLARAMA